jgi:hypothetical protein
MTLGYVLGLVALSGSTRMPAAAAARLVVGFGLVFRLTFVLLPGLFSTDVFSYVMYGRIAAVYRQNPYVSSPADFPGDPFLGWVFGFWRDKPSVYGPAWTDFSWLLSALTSRLSAFDQVLAYRLSLAAFELLGLGGLWWLLGRLHPNGSDEADGLLPTAEAWAADRSRGIDLWHNHARRRLATFALFAWNPLVLFDLVGNSHNDVAMVGLLLLGLVPIVGDPRGRGTNWLPGIAWLSLSALVKYLTSVALAVWTIAWVGQARTGRQRLVRLASSAAVALVFTGVLGWPWLRTSDTLAPLGDAAGGKLVLNSAPDLVALTLADQILQPLGLDAAVAQAIMRFVVRSITRVVFVVYFGWELWRVWSAASRREARLLQVSLEAAVRALLVLPLLVLTWVWSWYFSCALALAALLDRGSALRGLTVAYTLVAPPIVYAHQYLNQDLSGGLVLVFALGPVAGLLLWRWLTATVRHRQLTPEAALGKRLID